MEERASEASATRDRVVGALDWPSLLEGTALVALIAGSAAYGVALLLLDDPDELVGHNAVAGAVRRALILGVGSVALAAAGAALARAWFRARRGLSSSLLDGACSALPLGFFGPGVALLASSRLAPLPRIAAMAVFVVAFERALRVSFSALRRVPGFDAARFIGRLKGLLNAVSVARIGRIMLLDAAAWALSLGYVLYAAYFTVLRHRHFQTMSNDLGQYDNFFYNALHGRPFVSTPLFIGGRWSALRSHAEFSMYALLPFYALYPHAETLLVLQSALLGSAGIPIYRLGRRHATRLAGLALCAAYLAYAPLHGANFYDIHFQPIAMAFALWAIDFLDARQPLKFAVAFVLALASREDAPLIFMIVGVFVVVSQRDLRTGAALVFVSGFYFCVMKFVVMPHIGQWRYQFIYKDLFPPGDETYGGVVQTLISNPVFAFGTLLNDEKFVYALQILTPLAFLPLRGRWLWLSLVPGSVITLMTTSYAPTVQISFQYSAYLIALIFPAAALALGRLSGERRATALGALCAGTILTTAAWGAIPPRRHFRAGFTEVNFRPQSLRERKKKADLEELALLVPPRASLAVSEEELPHVSGRLRCYDLKDDIFGADFLLYEKASGGYGAERAHAALVRGEYVRVKEQGSIVLLRRKDYVEDTGNGAAR